MSLLSALRRRLPNTDQAKGQARHAATAVIAYAAGRHWLGDDTATVLLALLPLVGPFAWSLVASTDDAKIAAVEAMPDVAAIVPVPDATGAVAAAAEDWTRKKVFAPNL